MFYISDFRTVFEIRNIRLGWLARGTTINKEVNEK